MKDLWIIFKKMFSVYGLFVFLILMTNFDCFYLVKASSISFGIFTYYDIPLFLVLVFFLFTLIKFRDNHPFRFLSNKICLLLLGVLLLCCLASLQTFILVKQPIILGLRGQRLWMSTIFLYFSLYIVYENGKINKNQILFAVFCFTITEMAVITAQYFLYSKIIFTYVPTGTRSGRVRLAADIAAPCLVFCLSLGRLYLLMKARPFSKRSIIKIVLYLFLLIWIPFFVFYIASMRSASVGLATAAVVFLFISIFLSKWRKWLKIGSIVCLIAIALLACFIGPLNSIILEAINGTGDAGIRDAGRAYYFSILEDYPLLGAGFCNSTWPDAYILAGYDRKIFSVDNGIFGFVFQYGLIGLIWVFAFYAIPTKQAVRSMISGGDWSYLLVLAFFIVSGYTLENSAYYGGAAFVYLPVLLYYEIESKAIHPMIPSVFRVF